MTIFKSTFPPLPTPDRPFSYALLDALWMHRERTAVIDAETKRSATFQDLFLQSFSVATYLEKQHFHHGDVVCTVMHNSLENFPIFLGTALQGGALSGASFAFTEYELQYQFKDCKAKIVFCNELYLFKVLKAAQQCPSVQLIIVIPEDPENPKTYQFGVTSMTDVLNCQPNFYSRKVDVDIHRDIVTMPYSRSAVFLHYFNG
ncbi:hypothetical protein L596_026556 [Steinernema carpocapsae]|uniref:AMP-dependent synthetase/ligase domain-containing protein n=1 Tax=Steinernema carpocapsae TaxID=34508 RepID=A0A4U5M1R2_STECR|nr:hypothetical protein L596_026556 [Steinernema carpocapsae]